MKKVSLLLSLSFVIALLFGACNLNPGQANTPAPTETPAAAPTVASTPIVTATIATTTTGAVTDTTGVTTTTSTPVSTGVVTATQVATMPMQTTTPTATAMITVAPGSADVFRTISTIQGLETLNSALIATNLVRELDVTTRTFTIFAPNNEAFAALPTALRESAMADP
ncbi:MAG: fasciclin domain-containing protein, partial [Chloroflexi bacterium]|nr:fasciclin domain-containing protein [Chloroflexota bacterium]